MPPGTTTRNGGPRDTVVPHLGRLVDFAEPTVNDVCLDVACGDGPVPVALAPRVRHVTLVDAAPAHSPAHSSTRVDGRTPTVLFRTGATGGQPRPEAPASRRAGDPARTALAGRDPIGTAHGPRVRADAAALPYRDGTFTLVTSRFALYHVGDPSAVLREMLRVCRPGGRLVIADLVRRNLTGIERDRLERMRDPGHPGTPSIARLTEMITSAGADIRRLDLFSVERPLDSWLADAPGDVADRIRRALTDEVDGGPSTGARPRVISGELWFTQSWAHIAAQPVARGGP